MILECLPPTPTYTDVQIKAAFKATFTKEFCTTLNQLSIAMLSMTKRLGYQLPILTLCCILVIAFTSSRP